MIDPDQLVELCKFVSSRLRAERVRYKYSQKEMATLCNMSLRTYKRLELTGKGTIESLIRTLIVLNRVKSLNLLFSPPPTKRSSFIDRIEDLAKTIIENK